MALAIPFINGKDATLRLFVNGAEVIINAKSWSVSADTTKAADGVNGEDRDRLYSFINFFSFSANCFMDKAAQVDSLISYIANTDAQVAPFDVAAGVNMKIMDGSKKAYVGKEISLDDFQINQTDRKERVMFQLNFRGRYFDQVPTL